MGEESEVLFVANRVGDSAIGVAVKDLSTAYLYDNRFEENRRDVRATMKNPFTAAAGWCSRRTARGRRICRSTSTIIPR